jgi:hypothetical protein
MKLITGMALTVAMSLGVSFAAFGDVMKMTALSGGQQIRGQVESIDGSVVKIKTSSGDAQTYRVDPSVISALKLENGSNIVIDGTRLLTGTISSLDAYTAEIALDKGGDEQTYILTREARRYLTIGDRVVVTPDLRIVREDMYKLSASDLRIQSIAVASSASSSSVSASASTQTQANTGGVAMPAPVPAPVAADPAPAPVVGLW